ncbi:MAG: response regulator [Elusimicrobia bacterium]|nr:response regulator [Elusimicrobiota bacterium]
MKRTLMIIDDDPRVRELFRAALADEFEVVCAEGGQEGLDACRRSVPDVILLDLCMPRVDGMRVLMELRMEEGTSGVPVVVFSSARLDGPTRAALARHANVRLLLDKVADFRRFGDAVRGAVLT